MFVCGNQACGARWEPSEVEIRNEGQGPIFRCPLCGARNAVVGRTRRDGSLEYRQVQAKHQGTAAK
jgi:DNA-directed RNA polymerase subunit RPC12/RpoP